MPTTTDPTENFLSEEDEQSNDKHLQVDDVIAIKNTMHGFRTGKIHTVNSMDLHVHLFFYQLDDKNSEIVFKHDLLIDFGAIGTKKKVQLNNQHQKRLFEKLSQINNNSASLLQIIGDSTQKDHTIRELQLKLDKLSNMEIQLQKLVKCIVTAQNYDALIKQVCEDQIMTSNELLDYVFDHLNEIENEEKLKDLCRSMSHMYVEKKALMDIKKKYEQLTQADPYYNKKKTIIKTIAAGIGKLIEEGQFGNIEFEFCLKYANLCTLILNDGL